MKLGIAMASTLLWAGAVRAEIVVIVNPNHAAASMTAQQVADIYLGKDASLNPLDLKEPASVRTQFYEKVAGKDAAQIKAIWARLVFTGKQQPPKEMGSAAEVVKHVAANDKAIGYVEKSAVNGSVKTILSVN